MKKALHLGFMLGCSIYSYGQDTITTTGLHNVTVTVNKWEQSVREIPNKVTRVTRQQILHNNPQTAADLLTQTGTVFVQKSQLGGGSPMVRGFATNRVLLVADGIRMNNAIYRSGNLQNVISIDPLSIENADVIFGPGSLIYGSDAIGGVMSFHTLRPQFGSADTMNISGTGVTRYSTANREKTGHADINIGGKRWAALASFSYSDFGDLRMGSNGPSENYLRPQYVERVNNRDSIFTNADPRLQRSTGYTQTNFLGKVAFKATEYLTLQYAFTYGGTGTAPRYDRLIQYRNGNLRFAEWNYGPMLWSMHMLGASLTRKTAIADRINIIGGYQNYEESRIERARGNNNRTTQGEHVAAYNLNIDASKLLGQGELFYGLESVYNKVGSTGSVTNISTGNITPANSRYPNGSTWSTTGAYGSYKINLSSLFTVTTGLRYSYNTLDATFDTTFIKFPYRRASLRDNALTGNVGLVYRPATTWQINGSVSTGYRMPNIDDIGKLFESTPGNITVPNPDLTSEHAVSFEVGIVRNINTKFYFELNGFYTILDNAIVRRPFSFNGRDSITFSGISSRVEALQNVANATVWGTQATARYYFTSKFYVQSFANWTWGRETDDAKNEQVPLRHAPPFYGSSHIHYYYRKVHLEVYALYNSHISNKDLAPSERAKTDIYAKDEGGLLYSPGWLTLNTKASYQATKNLMINVGWENITDKRYRPYSSGVVAPGRNLILSLKVLL
jgi:hemoglobin/transferrin/lactoferrin receptor protein